MCDRYVVMTASAKMPNNCLGTYRRIAVIETDGVTMPKQINRSHRAVVRIVRRWERLNVGTTSRCAYQRALLEALALCAELNAEWEALAAKRAQD